MTFQLYDDTQCTLGEGPLWHPGRGQLFWFDILGQKLLTRQDGQPKHWDLPEIFSAAGWLDDDTLFVCSETGIYRFTIATGHLERLADLDADNPVTRSNDGRADPYGGFWIGTMGKNAEAKAGAIWRYYRGEVRLLYPGITVTNAICFAPGGGLAYFTDTRSGVVQKVRLDGNGWPSGDPEPFLDLREGGFNPDGAVTDANGHFWNAQWGAARVAEYDADGKFLQAIALPADRTTCPAFGGPDLTTLYCTSARVGIDPARLATEPGHGQTFAVEGAGKGLPEPGVIL